MNKIIRKLIAPLLILALGLAITFVLIKSKSSAKPVSPETVAPVVDVLQLKASPHRPILHARGQVQAAKSVNLAAEIAGRVVEISPKLIPGQQLKRGQMVARLDAREASLMVKQEESRVQQARTALEVELGRQGIAAREFKLLGGDKDSPRARLALRKPQLKDAELNLLSAQSGLQRAQLQLERSVLRAPFDALVVSKNVDPGQYLGPGGVVAKLIGRHHFWVTVLLPSEALQWLMIPGVNLAADDLESASRARVWQELSVVEGQKSSRIERQGRVIALAAELDAQTRSAQVIVQIDEPLGVEGQRPLLPGAYVEVEITGKEQNHSYKIPRIALFDGNKVWLVDAKQKLRQRSLHIAWADKDAAIVISGLHDGERVVLNAPGFPLQGMPVHIKKTTQKSQPRDDDKIEVKPAETAAPATQSTSQSASHKTPSGDAS